MGKAMMMISPLKGTGGKWEFRRRGRRDLEWKSIWRLSLTPKEFPQKIFLFFIQGPSRIPQKHHKCPKMDLKEQGFF